MNVKIDVWCVCDCRLRCWRRSSRSAFKRRRRSVWSSSLRFCFKLFWFVLILFLICLWRWKWIRSWMIRSVLWCWVWILNVFVSLRMGFVIFRKIFSGAKTSRRRVMLSFCLMIWRLSVKVWMLVKFVLVRILVCICFFLVCKCASAEFKRVDAL